MFEELKHILEEMKKECNRNHNPCINCPVKDMCDFLEYGIVNDDGNWTAPKYWFTNS